MLSYLSILINVFISCKLCWKSLFSNSLFFFSFIFILFSFLYISFFLMFVQAYMEEGGCKIRQGVTPTSIEKMDSGRLFVRYSDGEGDEFDTVVAAVGTYAYVQH